jgi:hypothetical protein
MFLKLSIEINTGKEKENCGIKSNCKVYFDTWIQEHINVLNYIECNISYEREKDFNVRYVTLNTMN